MTVVDDHARTLPRLDDAGRALLFTEARTANTFADTPVTDAELAGVWDLARWAPTAANTQPLRVVFVRREEGKARLVPLMAEGNQQKTAQAPATAILARDTRFHEHVPTVLPFRPEMREMLEENEGMREHMSTYGTTLQVAYFILAVRAQGLAAGPMAGFDAEAIDREFFPDGRFRSSLVVNIGHPGSDPWFDRLPRLDADEVVAWA
ncbi:malonic semialdehyde reductase [Actinomycetospora sp. TBRC 11914]|uniref:malonic semialdehyde reductase n=1 Tax=Actinomycetospora sp. TBRC 11914 TaxID=2729387 RepID=UPI00145F9917|nr:malonic semialdehyde reductase [Actinomycetospora sp. TBRC 11914]NMO93107.1 malonic semialdehyde reductase [Actinomycetospora sp. TBRC 11914]